MVKNLLSPARQVGTGFPSPADDFIEPGLDLNELMIEHPAASFFVRAAGLSMLGAGIQPRDLLLVDRAVTPTAGDVVMAVIDGEFVVKYMATSPSGLVLASDNPRYPPLAMNGEHEILIWGVVRWVIHKT